MPAHHRMAAAILAATIAISLGVPRGADGARRSVRQRDIAVESGNALSLDSRATRRGLDAAAAAETSWLAAWDFDSGGSCVTDGWTSVDLTDQPDDFFHVDDFAGLGGGDFGRLVALEGNQSMWCGLRPSTTIPYCSYATLPGYGNSWDQFLVTDCLSFTGDVVVDYRIAWDSEPGYDWSSLYADTCSDRPWYWTRIEGGPGVWEGVGSGFYSSVVPDSLHVGTLRLRFRFESDGAWSDEDGLFDSDGAVIIDSLTVSDATGTVLSTETFEAESPGDKTTLSGHWTAGRFPGYGDFASLFEGTAVLQQDPCKYNATCLWGFFSGSTRVYDCGLHPEQAVVPFENSRGQYIDNEIRSPWTPVAGAGNTWQLAFDVYRDLPLDNLVFYEWHVRFLVGGCPAVWLDRDLIYFGASQPKDWFRYVEDFSDLVDPAGTDIQVALGVVDMCPRWCGIYGYTACHTQAPLFDNVEVRRIDTNGPRWFVEAADLFQDNFASDGTTTGTVRADAARDLNAWSSPGIRPGDSVSVTVSDHEGSLTGDPYTGVGPAVYAYVNVEPSGQSTKAGSALTSDAIRWPVVDAVSAAGRTWWVVRLDTSFTLGEARQDPVPDRFCVDLNDNLFTPGDTISYLFGATGLSPGTETTYYTRFTGTTDDASFAFSNPMEFTCLPTQNANVAYPVAGGGATAPILYVDGADGQGVQPWFDAAFEALGIAGAVDRYDVLSPSSIEGNHPGGRVVDVVGQLIPAYRKIIWNTGDVSQGAFGEGYYSSEKSDDAGILLEFLDHLPGPGGVYLSGNNIAAQWSYMNYSGVALRAAYLPHFVVSSDHVYSSYPVSPWVIGVGGGIFDHLSKADSLVAWGGCPGRDRFDVLRPQGTSMAQMFYEGTPDPSLKAALISCRTLNPDSVSVGVVLSGFSDDVVRDEHANGQPADAAHHLHDILAWLAPDVIIAVPTPNACRNSLAQNYPNPFNPATMVEFTVREKAQVTLRVYNVRGQLVRTLVDGVRAPSIVHRIEWDGRNDAGQRVASGVYFYRMSTREFTRTRKMVLLK